MTRALGRRAPSRVPLARVVVVTEGILTEPGYLKTFGQLFGTRLARVVPVPAGGDPRTVVERAIDERKRSRPLDGLSKRDSYWAMFDRDEHARFEEAIDLAAANKIGLAVSNPCFELWAVMHYETRDAPSHRRECQKRLAQLHPAYTTAKRFEDREPIENGYRDAVRRARTLLTRRAEEGSGRFANPSTTVHRLTEHIRLWGQRG